MALTMVTSPWRPTTWASTSSRESGLQLRRRDGSRGHSWEGRGSKDAEECTACMLQTLPAADASPAPCNELLHSHPLLIPPCSGKFFKARNVVAIDGGEWEADKVGVWTCFFSADCLRPTSRPWAQSTHACSAPADDPCWLLTPARQLSPRRRTSAVPLRRGLHGWNSGPPGSLG